MRYRLFAIAAAFALAFMLPASASASVIVPGNANPFLAGQPTGESCCSGDSVPGQSPVLAWSGFAGGEILTFATSGGALYLPGTPCATADGECTYLFDMTADDHGLAGPKGVNVSALVGVFIGSGVPGGAAPAQRDDGQSFLLIAPALYQIFWIGDGLTGTGGGIVQQFVVPVGAERLYLGTADGFGWANNDGAITVDIGGLGAVPEPASWAMMIAGLAMAGGAMRRRSARVRAA